MDLGEGRIILEDSGDTFKLERATGGQGISLSRITTLRRSDAFPIYLTDSETNNVLNAAERNVALATKSGASNAERKRGATALELLLSVAQLGIHASIREGVLALSQNSLIEAVRAAAIEVAEIRLLPPETSLGV